MPGENITKVCEKNYRFATTSQVTLNSFGHNFLFLNIFFTEVRTVACSEYQKKNKKNTEQVQHYLRQVVILSVDKYQTICNSNILKYEMNHS